MRFIISFDILTYTYLTFQLVNHSLPRCRRPCLKAPSCLTARAEEGMPIRVAPKAKRQKRLQNVFLDDRGFPDQSNEYDHLLHNIDGGPVLRKLKHPALDSNAPVTLSFSRNSFRRSMKLRCVKMWTCLIWTPTSRREYIA